MKDSELSECEVHQIGTRSEKGAQDVESAPCAGPPDPGAPAAGIEEQQADESADRALEHEFPDVVELLRHQARVLDEGPDSADGDRAWAELKARFARRQAVDPAGPSLDVALGGPVYAVGPARRGTHVARPREEVLTAPSGRRAVTAGWPPPRWPEPVSRKRNLGRDLVTALGRWLADETDRLFPDSVGEPDLTSDLGRALTLVDVLRRLEYGTSRVPQSAVLLLPQRTGGYLIAIRESAGEFRGRAQFSFTRCLYGILDNLDSGSRHPADPVWPERHDFILMACFAQQAGAKPAKKSRYTIGEADDNAISEFLGYRRAPKVSDGNEAAPSWSESRLARLLRKNATSVEIPTSLPIPGLSQPSRRDRAAPMWSDRLARASQQIVNALANPLPSLFPDGNRLPASGGPVTVASMRSWNAAPGHTCSSREPTRRCRHRAQGAHTYVMWAGDVHDEGFGSEAAGFDTTCVSMTRTRAAPSSLPPLDACLPSHVRGDKT